MIMEPILRSPICGIFGHVDSGKTSFLSCLRSFESVEAGGITQNVSSIFISIDKIKQLCKKIIDFKEVLQANRNIGKPIQEAIISIPGVLFMDTPGHEAFKNFRQKASDICDLGIVIVDIEKGIENQTIESIKMLQLKKVPFIIVLTKLDKVVGWNSIDTTNLRESLKNQNEETINMLNAHLEDVKFELEKNEIKAEFYFKNKTPGKVYSIIPVSNKSKEGFNDLINFLVFIVQNFMNKKLNIQDKPKMFVFDHSFDKNLGWICNVILANGTVRNGDKIVIQTPNGPVKSVIRNIVGLKINKGTYERKFITSQTASEFIQLFAPNLENVIDSTFIHTYSDEKEYEEIIKLFNKIEEKKSFLESIKNSNKGFQLISSTEGEFEAGYQVLKDNQVEIVDGFVGPLTEKVIDQFEINANRIQKQNCLEDLDEYRILLYYTNVTNKVSNFNDLVEYAKKKQVQIIYGDVIYQLIEQFNKCKNDLVMLRKTQYKKDGVVQLPVELKLLKNFIFMKGGSSEILCGFKVIGGQVNVGCEIIGFNSSDGSKYNLGKIIKIEKNHKEITNGNKNEEICIKFSNPEHLIVGKHITPDTKFYSNITRPGLEILKRDFKTDLNKEDWILTGLIVKNLNI